MTILHEFPVIGPVPEVTTNQMIEIDRLMMEHYRISLVQMMENAGRALAVLARDRFLAGTARGKRIAVLAGSGGNGGGVITAARRLAIWGADIHLGLLRPRERMSQVARRQLDILDQVSIVPDCAPADLDTGFDLILDGLIGHNVSGPLEDRAKAFADAANAAAANCLALDVPSGYDAGSAGFDPGTVRADATLTLALPKFGMQRPEHRCVVGSLFCADISVPAAAYALLSPPVRPGPIFAQGDLVFLG